MVDKKGSTPADSFAEAVNQHNLGVDGDKEAVKTACKMFKKIYSDNPQDCLAEAYLGSATALLGRDEIDPNKRFKFALDGLKILERAVSKEPRNIEIRILRGMVCYRLPEIYFHRLSTAVEDFNFLISQYEKNKKVFSHDFYCKILFDLGSAYKQLERGGEAETTWKKLLSVTKDTKYIELLKEEGFTADSEVEEKPKSRGFGFSRRRNR